MTEVCDACNAGLEAGQIGKCDACQREERKGKRTRIEKHGTECGKTFYRVSAPRVGSQMLVAMIRYFDAAARRLAGHTDTTPGWALMHCASGRVEWFDKAKEAKDEALKSYA